MSSRGECFICAEPIHRSSHGYVETRKDSGKWKTVEVCAKHWGEVETLKDIVKWIDFVYWSFRPLQAEGINA